MRITTAIQEIIKALEKNIPVYIHGSPGIGKSEMVWSIHDIVKHIYKSLIQQNPSQTEPIDWRGLPTVTNEETKWLKPNFLPTSGTGIFFIDEMSSCPPALQSVMFQFIRERRIGDYRLPDGWRIIAAGNKDSDRGVTYKMSTPLASRFFHVNIDVDNDDWIKWALNNNVDPMVIAFIKFRPALLHSFDPSAGHQTFPCPRTWKFLSDFIKGEDYNTVLSESASGIIGPGAAPEFMGFLKVYNSLPEIKTIIESPETAKTPTEPATLYAISSALTRKELIKKHMDQILTYVMRLPAEYAVMTVKDCIMIDSSAVQCKKFSDFAKKYAEVLI